MFVNNRMTINSNGNIGMGTSSPSTKLHIGGNIKQIHHHFLYKIWLYFNNQYHYGKVGLGITNPSTKLHIVSGSVSYIGIGA